MTHVSHIGFTKPVRKLTLADRFNAVLPFSARPKCGLCSKPMMVRLRKVDQAPFWGCDFPRCSWTRPIDPKKFQAAVDALNAPVVQRPEIIALAERTNDLTRKMARDKRLPLDDPLLCVDDLPEWKRVPVSLPTQKDFD